MSRAIQLDTLIQEVLRKGHMFVFWRVDRRNKTPVVCAVFHPKRDSGQAGPG